MRIMLYGGDETQVDNVEECTLLEVRGYDALCYRATDHPMVLARSIAPIVLRPDCTDRQARKAVHVCRLNGNVLLHFDDLPAMAPASMEVLDALNVIEHYDPCVPLTIELYNGEEAQVYATPVTVRRVSGLGEDHGVTKTTRYWRRLVAACARTEKRINAFFGDGLKNPMSRQVQLDAERGRAHYRADLPPAITG